MAADPPRPRLAPVSDRTNTLSVRLGGFDPAAPRPLVLWREDLGGFRPAGETFSRSDGRFDFGQHPRLAGRAVWAVTPLGTPPDAAHAILVEGPLPAPSVLPDGRSALRLRILPALYEGAIQVRDADTGRLLLHRPVDPAETDALEIDVEAEGWARSVRRLAVGQRTADGRTSAVRYWPLD